MKTLETAFDSRKIKLTYATDDGKTDMSLAHLKEDATDTQVGQVVEALESLTDGVLTAVTLTQVDNAHLIEAE
ncbi:hypothetical protein PT285_11295 [Lactobacillus sp. ESL0791]|uniref:DUF1659 domain-containing protein n=1 Tax=Lactobacillus sp. ESL0791 TaxID=2983234 RepID=UPI0023FA3DF7|nr:hypothetical protein [Lactobacillus sp. ESL0791]MDF7639987.1 hypothetical protein [Lactobacillus sp. ESL0791]